MERFLQEDETLTIEEATMAASCLAALGGPSHEEGYGMLAAMAERATRQGWRRSLMRARISGEAPCGRGSSTPRRDLLPRSARSEVGTEVGTPRAFSGIPGTPDPHG
jgi:hypothetical protein